MQVITQFTGWIENTHINDGNVESFAYALRHHGWQRVVERLDGRGQARALGGNDFRYKNHGVGNGFEHIVEQEAQACRGLRVWFRRRVAAIQVVGTGVQEDYVRLESQARAGDSANLIDGVPGEALVVLVCHGTGFLRSHIVDLEAGGLQVAQEFLAVAIGSTAIDEAPGDGVA